MTIKKNGIGTIRSFDKNDEVLFSAASACHAVVKNGKARFQSLGRGAHVPKIGLKVAFIAGYDKLGDKFAIAEVWCSLDSWDKARVEAHISFSENAPSIKEKENQGLEEEFRKELLLPKSPPRTPSLFPEKFSENRENKQKTPRGVTGRALKRSPTRLKTA